MIAIIGGTGLYDPHVFSGKEERIMTSYGAIDVVMGSLDDKKVVFLARHGTNHSVPPHKVNYKANIIGLKGLGVERIIAINSVGSINDKLAPGDLIAPNDFIDLTRGRGSTFFDDEVVHVDLSNPYCPEVRSALLLAAEDARGKIFDGGVYACTQGPRFETPAEIRMLSTLGSDIVGMTGLPEAVLAREQELCYASICTVTNYAAGISKEKLTASEVKEVVEGGLEDLKKTIIKAIELMPGDRGCGCGEALSGARM